MPGRSTLSATPSAASGERYGTFAGVYRPVFLTILGAMLYLREGWLVGNAGVLGALVVIGVAYAITGTTALSLASLATNVRVRPGGAFAIIATALGLEAGGAIGIPLFLAQTLSASMYLFAFAEAWQVWFPEHSAVLVAGVAFVGVAALSAFSSRLALAAQMWMLAVVGVALGSIFLGIFSATPTPIEWVGRFEDVSLLGGFAVFFPAATGIMVGVGMSGSLSDPRRSIPVGTLGAWGTTLVVYVAAAFWYAWVADVPDLTTNKLVVLEHALSGPVVHVGLLTSTLMAALSSIVAAPRLLQAMAEHNAVPAARWLSRTTASGNPLWAIGATLVVLGLSLLSGSLDAIAPVVTSFFVLTYLAINLVVASERGLGMISFRPTFRISLLVPLLGAALCLVTLGLTSPFGGVPEFIFVVLIFFWLERRNLDTPWETVNSGAALRLADWAARLAAPLQHSVRAWKPDLLVPASTSEEVAALTPLVRAITRRTGSIKWVGTSSELERPLAELAARWTKTGAYTTATTLDASFPDATRFANDALRGAFFPPNLVVVDGAQHALADLQPILDQCRQRGLGMVIAYPQPDGGFTAPGGIAVWLSSRHPEWKVQLHMLNIDLPLLLGLLLQESLEASLSLYTVVAEPRARALARAFLIDLKDAARLPRDTSLQPLAGDFVEQLAETPRGALHLLGMPPRLDPEHIARIREATQGAVLFVLDSGEASALA